MSEVSSLYPIYVTGLRNNRSKEKIDEFVEEYHLEMGKSINEIGEEKIQKIIKEFNDIVRTV